MVLLTLRSPSLRRLCTVALTQDRRYNTVPRLLHGQPPAIASGTGTEAMHKVFCDAHAYGDTMQDHKKLCHVVVAASCSFLTTPTAPPACSLAASVACLRRWRQYMNEQLIIAINRRNFYEAVLRSKHPSPPFKRTKKKRAAKIATGCRPSKSGGHKHKTHRTRPSFIPPLLLECPCRPSLMAVLSFFPFSFKKYDYENSYRSIHQMEPHRKKVLQKPL
jgi:hypothetical protein